MQAFHIHSSGTRLSAAVCVCESTWAWISVKSSRWSLPLGPLSEITCTKIALWCHQRHAIASLCSWMHIKNSEEPAAGPSSLFPMQQSLLLIKPGQGINHMTGTRLSSALSFKKKKKAYTGYNQGIIHKHIPWAHVHCQGLSPSLVFPPSSL